MASSEQQSTAGASGNVSLFTNEEIERRFSYHAPSGAAIGRHENVRAFLKDAAYYLNSALPDGREKALALTKLEEVGFHAQSAIARDPSLHDRSLESHQERRST